MQIFRKVLLVVLSAAAILLLTRYFSLLNVPPRPPAEVQARQRYLAPDAYEAKTKPEGTGCITVMTNIEQTSALPHPAFIKEEYIPVIPEGTNIARSAKLEANAFADVYTARKAADGKTAGASYWEGEPDAYPNILTATFESLQTIHAIRLCLCPLSVWSRRTQTFSVEVSQDGEAFRVLQEEAAYSFDPDKGNETVLTFEDTEAKAIRLTFTGNTGASGAQLAEFEIYSR